MTIDKNAVRQAIGRWKWRIRRSLVESRFVIQGGYCGGDQFGGEISLRVGQRKQLDRANWRLWVHKDERSGRILDQVQERVGQSQQLCGTGWWPSTLDGAHHHRFADRRDMKSRLLGHLLQFSGQMHLFGNLSSFQRSKLVGNLRRWCILETSLFKPLLLNGFQLSLGSLPFGHPPLLSASLCALLAHVSSLRCASSTKLTLHPIRLAAAESSFAKETLLP